MYKILKKKKKITLNITILSVHRMGNLLDFIKQNQKKKKKRLKTFL